MKQRIAACAVAGVLGAGIASLLAGRRAWHRGTDRATAGLRRARRDAAPTQDAPRPTERPDVPAPVARYFAFAIPEGYTRIRSACVHWTGEFRARPDAAWVPFTAVQEFTDTPPGFVWDARIRLAPLVPMRVRDSYIEGDASMLGRIGGLVTAVQEGGTPEIAESALARWLGEAVWFPTALVPRAAAGAVTWEALDDSAARASVADGPVHASAEFHFDADGSITRMTTMRYRDVNGTTVLTPFEGTYRNFARWNGVLVPMHAEVAWLLPQGRYAYWRGSPSAVQYDFG